MSALKSLLVITRSADVIVIVNKYYAHQLSEATLIYFMNKTRIDMCRLFYIHILDVALQIAPSASTVITHDHLNHGITASKTASRLNEFVPSFPTAGTLTSDPIFPSYILTPRLVS